MKKKRIALALACLSMAVGAFAVGASRKPVAAYAEGEPDSSEVVQDNEPVQDNDPVQDGEPEPTQESVAVVSYKIFHIDEKTGESIADVANKYGDVAFSITEGAPGDKVLAVVQGNPVMSVNGKTVSLFRYIVQAVTVNGEIVQPTNYAKGEYEFTLVEGANVFEVYFGGKAEISVMDLASLNWSSLLTVDNLLRLIVLAVLLLVSSGFFITLLKKGKIESITKEQFAEQAQKVVNAAVKDFLENDVKELLSKQTLLSQEATETAQVLMRVTLLAQENTPEARLEIIKELQKYKSTDQELAAKIQEILDGAIRKRDELEVAKKATIEQAKKAINDIKPISIDDNEGSSFGKL